MPSRSKPFSLTAFAAFLCCLAAVGLGTSTANGATRGGGLDLPSMPGISDVICLTGCTKMREVSVDGTVQITGTDMDTVKAVAFRGKSKNIRVEPDVVTSSRVEAKVPDGAVTGRVRVVVTGNSVSEPSRQILTIGDKTFTRTGKLTLTDASTSPTRAFQFGMRHPVLDFVVNGSTPRVDLRVDIVNSAGDVVRSRFLNDVPTGSTQKVGWSGMIAKGKTAPNGAYHFLVRGNDGTAATLSARLKRERRLAARASRTSKGDATDPFSFRMYGFVFPVRAPHTYGDGIGAPRAGHTHQGQDVMASCGSRMVAARAGVVYYNTYDSAGGWYLVINTRANGGRSMVYMHMPSASPLKVGTRVKTGQPIGRVGDTGDATACHLHFEIWSGPGWYQGGTFLNPTPSLKAWDRYS